jgi:hypothetical protein
MAGAREVRYWRHGLILQGSKSDCQACALKPRCCPNTPHRKVPRDLDEDARDFARTLASTPAFEQSRHLRKKIEMLFAHLKRILRLGRLRLRGPAGARDGYDGGKGYAVGINADWLNQNAQSQNFHLFPILYSQNEQEKAAAAAIRLLLEMLHRRCF